MRICGHPKPDGNPCKQTILTANGRCKRHAESDQPPVATERLTGPGGQPGNQNPRTHGLFSKSLGEHGQEVYSGAKLLPPEQLAREAADFAVAKVAEVFGTSHEAQGAVALVESYLDGLVLEERITRKTYDFLMRRLTEPDIGTMGKALAPLKGLLEIKPVEKPPGDDDATAGLKVVPAKSPDWRNLIGG